jgi:hypothetical protein
MRGGKNQIPDTFREDCLMKQYKVFTRSASTVLVKQGWSWPAFLIPPIWALTKRLWGVGAGVLIGGITLAFIFESMDIDRSEPFYILVGIELAVRIIFGMNGNSWREVNLVSRGFTESRMVTVGQPKGDGVEASGWQSRYPLLNKLWNDPVWSKVIASGIAGVAALVLALVAYVHNGRARPSIDLTQPKYIATCNTAVMEGDFETSADVTLVWFEWGPTPELGNTTMKQPMTTKSGDFYQHLSGLTENTRYYYRAMSENEEGLAVGKVGVFITSRCESSQPAR